MLKAGINILQKEADALESAASRVGNELVSAAHLICRCKDG